MTKAELLEAFRADGLATLAEQIEPWVRHTVAMTPELTPEDEIPVGASKFGGRPDVPGDFAWPVTDDGTPLSFLAQINLSDFATLDIEPLLPPTGFLQFFYDTAGYPWGDPEGWSGWRVYYLPGETLLHRPTGGTRSKDIFPSAALHFRVRHSLGDEALELLQSDATARSNSNIIKVLLDDSFITGRESDHRLLGHPVPIQSTVNGMATQCEEQLVGITEGAYDGRTFNSPADYARADREFDARFAANWQFLMQFDADDKFDWQWGDAGRLYFWIRKEDLAQRNFDNVWLIGECC